MKKMLLLLLVLPMFTAALTAQEEYYRPEKALDSQTKNTPNVFFERNKYKFGLDMGMGVFATSGDGAQMYSWVSPHLTTQVNQRLFLTFGAIVTNSPSFGYSNSPFESYQPLQRGLTTAVYASGAYLLNERTIITGSVIHETNLMNTNSGNQRPANATTTSIGIDYKLARNVTVGFQMQRSQGVPSYYNTGNPSILGMPRNRYDW